MAIVLCCCIVVLVFLGLVCLCSNDQAHQYGGVKALPAVVNLKLLRPFGGTHVVYVEDLSEGGGLTVVGNG